MLADGPIEALRLEVANSYRTLVRETPRYTNLDPYTRLLLCLADDLAKLPQEVEKVEDEALVTTPPQRSRILNYTSFFSYCIANREVTNPDNKTAKLSIFESKIFLPLILNSERVIPYNFLMLPFARLVDPNQNFRIHLANLRKKINDQSFRGGDGMVYWWYIQTVPKCGLELRVKRPGLVLW